MIGQLQALAVQDLVKGPTEHTGQRAGWTLGAAEGSRESTPPPEIKLQTPGRLSHGLLTVPYGLPLPRQEVNSEKYYSSVRKTHTVMPA
jgi:hypothetical protein